MSAPLPDIYGTLDYRAWLRDWFDAKKAQNPRFSHRAFVRRTGQKSPSLLADVIGGRRNLTPAGIDGFVKALGLTGLRESFFRELVQLDQAKTADERAEALERITATRHFRKAQRLEGASLRFLSHWSYPAVHELAGCSAFRDDPAWIASQVRPAITEPQAREALEVLETLELLVRDAQGVLRQGPGTLTTPHQAASAVSFLYHRGMNARAEEALGAFPAKERHFCGVTVSIPESMMPRLKAEIDAFQERMLALCDDAPDAERVVQLYLQLFPLSARFPTEEPR